MWNVRRAMLDPRIMKASTRCTAAACARLSRRAPAAIVVNSHAGAEAHRRAGYAADKMTILPNGVDTAAFRPNPEARVKFRRDLGLDQDVTLVAHVARYEPCSGGVPTSTS